MTNEVDFLHADKDDGLLQIDSMILMGMGKHFQSPQNSKFAMSLQYYKKKKLRMKLIFSIQIKIKVSSKFISALQASKFPTRLVLPLLMGTYSIETHD